MIEWKGQIVWNQYRLNIYGWNIGRYGSELTVIKS